MTYHDHEEELFGRWAERARKLHDADLIAKYGLDDKAVKWLETNIREMK